VLQLGSLIQTVSGTPSPGELIRSFVPPPRFSDKRFEGYVPDDGHPTQALARDRVVSLASELRRTASPLGWLRTVFGSRPARRGVYLDGGFGVGKTHLLAALWNAAPVPSAYLSFDELVYTIGLLGVARTREAFRGQRLVAVDEWELDDPGNLKMAVAWLRGALEDGIRVAVTSNTVPDELGRGRFSQKSFAAEIEELGAAFEVVHIAGDDYRHRHFEADPGRDYFRGADELRDAARNQERALLVAFETLLEALGRVHPIRYDEMVARLDALYVEGLAPITRLHDGLRWVHFVDKLYDGAVPMSASSGVDLAELFPAEFVSGAYGKKFSRCLSRMEEMLGEYDATPEVVPGWVP
jgi:cell division protein ZapE